MSCATDSGRVAGERAAGAAEAVVERDGGGERGEAHGDAHEEVVEGAGAVAFEAEDVLGGPEDRFDALPDRGQGRAGAALVLAARAQDRGVERGEVGLEVLA